MDLRDLSETQYDQLQECADAFADAIRENPDWDWAEFLPPPTDAMRRVVLIELIKVDLELGWQQGRTPRLADYLARFSELGRAASLPADLIAEEFLIRLRNRQSLTLEEYLADYPDQRGDLERLLPPLQQRMQRLAESGTVPGESGSPASPSDTPVGASPTDATNPVPRDGVRIGALPIVGNGYQLAELIGAGHFGRVWKAIAPGGIEVAIKEVTQPADHEAAQRELQALELVKSLRHTCLLMTQAFWTENNRLYIVMELADGSLRDRLRQCREEGFAGIPVAELIGYFRDAAEGLDFLHSRRVLHRDIKPDNLLLLHDHAKVADFGLARYRTSELMAVSYAGTPVYMAPEVWGGRFHESSDQYSLAFAYAELRLGRRPLDGNDFVEVMSRHLEATPDLTGMEPGEADAVARALAKKPADRFPSARAFVHALESSLGDRLRDSSTRPLPSSLRRTHAQSLSRPSVTMRGSRDFEGVADALASVPNAAASDPLNRTQSQSTDSLPVPGPVPAIATQPESTSQRIRRRRIPWLRWTVGGIFALLAVGLTIAGLNQMTQSSPSTEGESRQSEGTNPGPNEPWPPTRYAGTESLQPPVKTVLIQGRRLLERLEAPGPDGLPIRFHLITAEGGPPFYMMENKVWNRLFEQFASEQPDAVKGTAWLNRGDRLPAMMVTADEAMACARWLGGTLPTPEQWDAATGWGQRPAGATGLTTGARVAIHRAEPLPVGTSADDVSSWGLFDLAGNGREFTRQLWTPPGQSPRYLPQPITDDGLIILRGRMVTLRKPLEDSDLQREQTQPQTQSHARPSRYTTFRAVIEIPTPPRQE